MKELLSSPRVIALATRGIPPEEAAVLDMRADLMAKLRRIISQHGWTQQQASGHLGISQSRVSDLVRGKCDKFRLDMLIKLAARVGQKLHLVLEAA
ncbi:MAG: XRE family transcriptional regulator [Glaciimonas sp.]|nr:XRE family transcriptional regulator [Glaciimonas sp.]